MTSQASIHWEFKREEKETRCERKTWRRMETRLRPPGSHPNRMEAVDTPWIDRLATIGLGSVPSLPSPAPGTSSSAGTANARGERTKRHRNDPSVSIVCRVDDFEAVSRARRRGEGFPRIGLVERGCSDDSIGRWPFPLRSDGDPFPVRNRRDVRLGSIRTSDIEARPFEARLRRYIMTPSDAERIVKDGPLKHASFSNAFVAYTAHSGSEKTGLWAYLDGSRMFFAGGAAGAVARTCTAPLDRIKLLFQVQAVQSAGVSSTAYTGVWQSVAKIWKEEGVKAYWKGNGTNVIRIFPYSAAQLMANDQYKRILADEGGNLSVAKRLTAGACAGMTATALTHPLDTVRLRLALPNNSYNGMMNAVVNISSKEGVAALYKGLAPTLIGIAPYAALNFSSYDLLKTWAYGGGNEKQSPLTNIGIGAAAGTFAATVCYPLDTVRRRMQMPGHVYSGQVDALVQIFQKEGMRGFFRGWAANTLKVVPQNSIRFVTYEFLKSMLGVKKAKTDT